MRDVYLEVTLRCALHNRRFDVTTDGQRFIAVVQTHPTQVAAIIRNLPALLAHRAAASTQQPATR